MRFNTSLLSVIPSVILSVVTAATTTQNDICTNQCAFELSNNMALSQACNSNDQASTLQCQCYALKFGYECLKKCDSSIASVSVDEMNLYCKNAGVDSNTILNDPRFNSSKGPRNSSIQTQIGASITFLVISIVSILI